MQLPPSDAAANAFAREWIAAWNSHDAARIIQHYADDVHYESPFIEALLPGAGGVLRGRDAVRAYIERGLEAYPGLRFTLRNVLTGARSLVIEYDSVRGLIGAETLTFGEDGRVEGVLCHYRPGELHIA